MARGAGDRPARTVVPHADPWPNFSRRVYDRVENSRSVAARLADHVTALPRPTTMSSDSATARATGLAVGLSPDGQQRIQDATVRRSRRLARREIVAAGGVGGARAPRRAPPAAAGPAL